MKASHFIYADWPAPAHVHALTSTRQGGVSEQPFASLNLALHVQDHPERVRRNRTLLADRLQLPGEPLWLNQQHGCQIADDHDSPDPADACLTRLAGKVCLVMTADCLPILISNRQGTLAAAVHAGWRGLAAGLLQKVLGRLDDDADNLLVWLGPAIGPNAYEVGAELREAFLRADERNDNAFRDANRDDHWFADIYQLARNILVGQGVTAIYGGRHCTFGEPELFFSYRRDGLTGRMASLVWFDATRRTG